MASHPDSQPPSVREEGELSSSSDDEELLASSKERLSDVSNSVGGAAPDKGNLVDTGGENAGFRKSVEKSHVPSRSSITKWNGKSRPDDNLVIVFSDNESGSDNEGKQKKATEVKGVTSINENRRPAPISYPKVGFPQKANVDKPRFQQNRGLFSRTFIASNTKPIGPKLKDAAKPVIKPGSFVKNHDALDQKVVNQFVKPKQGPCLDIGVLQDLRQKIAIRETELKLNLSRKNRETKSGSSQMYDSYNTDINIQKRERAIPMASDYVHPEVTEPYKKRMKVDLSGQRKQSATVKLVEQGGKVSANSFRNTSGPGINSSGGQSNISCQHKSQLVLNRHAETVHGVSYCQKELDSLGNKFEQGCNINTYGPGNLSLQSLFSFEEMLDKELQEAQGHRRHCEIEERLARRAYHKARSALVEATCRCKSLYQQRELSSAQFLSLLIGEANVHVHSRSAMDQVAKSTRVYVDEDRTLQLLLELEDSQEKELQEAQEYRHKCEIDESNFLKAYRRTQCALIESSDRCNCLYLQKQQSVTRANVEFYSRCYNQFEGSAADHLNSQSRVDLDVIHSSQYARQAHTDANLVRSDSNFRSTSNVPAIVSNQSTDGNNIITETCNEPDSSTSELMPRPDSNADHLHCSSYSSPAISVDQNEQVFAYDRPCPPESGCQKQSPSPETKNGPGDEDVVRTFPADCDQDSLLQEAKLRSELRSRLGKRPFSQKVSCDIQSMQLSVERTAENDIGSQKSEVYTSELELSKEEKTQLSSRVVDPDLYWDTQLSFKSAALSPNSVLRSTFACIKNLNFSFCKSVILQAENPVNLSCNMSNFKGSDNCSEKTQFTASEDNRVLSVKDIFSKQYESYSCNLDADLFWPLCTYELRGKCNDEQCCLQHIKVHQDKNTIRRGSRGTACSIRQKFPTSIAASRLLQRKMLIDELSGHCGNRWFQANESNRKLSYLHSQGTLIVILLAFRQFMCQLAVSLHLSIKAKLENSMSDVESSLEMALLILDREIDKFEGANKVEALSLLSRAIEVDPKCSAIWIVYLLIYYSSERSNEKDDMFFYAVENNAWSYELWLLYINSRMELNGRLVAYNKALSALCSESSDSDTSSFILDIFLQMLEFLCASGQVEKAMAKVQELIHSASTSDESHRLLSRLYSLLTVSDKNILWVCCIYLGVYRRLPEAVLHRFELEKELLEVGWPAVELKDGDMEYAKQLMIAVEQIVDLYIDVVSVDSVTNWKSVQFFAINHFRCKVALKDFNSGIKLAEKYIKLYPSFREFVLLMARMYSNDFQDLTVSGFEEALSNWPEEVLGIHCIWNQYAAHALENQRFDIASELLCRWYESAWKCQPAESQMSKDDRIHQNQHAIAIVDSLSKADDMFGWLTLALYHKLRNEHHEAQLAVDRALSIAPPDMYKHCVREHAAYHYMDVQPKEDASISYIVNLLNSYLVDPRASLESCVLSRKFISEINKSRVQQMVNKFLAEISPDCGIINAALEAWYGPSLLPQNCNETKELVNLVEAVMEIVPTNYRFASCVLRQVSRDLNAKDARESSLLFWASNLLVSSILEAVPVAPECVWVEVSDLLSHSTSIQEISDKFHERAVSVYPFSMRLWKSYVNMARVKDNCEYVIKRARERGLQLEMPQQPASN
ncbi:unnamed protein product [Rhodiola kirilowii]